MSLQFERGDRSAPVGHTLIYFRGDNDSVLAAYVSIPPIRFDPTKYLPPMFGGMMQGMDMSEAMAVIPTPPIPEEVASVEYLHAIAERRHDDLLYGGKIGGSNPMQLASALTEVAGEYAEAYKEYVADMVDTASHIPEPAADDVSPYASMDQQEQLKELTMLTGRLQDSLERGPDPEVESQMRQLADLLPAKYHAHDLLQAAHIPGERGRSLSGLYLERCYKLFNEDYLDLERIDREIEALQG